MNKTQQITVFQNNIFGICMMLLHAVALSVLYAVVKELTQELSSNVIVFLYKFMILVCALPWCFYGGMRTLKTNRIWLHMSRGFLSVCGSLSMFYAIKHIGLSDVTAVAYLEQIVLLIVGILYFKERATKTKIVAIIISFVGAIFIIKSEYFMRIYEASLGNSYNSSSEFNSFYIFVFMAIAFWSLNSTVIKILGKTEKTKVQLFYVMLFSCIIAFPIAFMDWAVATKIGVMDIKYPVSLVDFTELGLTWKHIGYIFVLAICYFLHVIGHFKAFKHAELSVVVPFEYTRLVFAGILGYCFFSEVALPPSYIGYILIIISGVAIFRAEQKKRKKQRAQELEEEFDQA
ncbi:MAG: DMT family transporter [Alphaproteobacteria bacterium]|jgi:S-adenosylmethionine uptake transporter|nr:DMT family transporter [Candidatus Jidaibacter sp.]